MKSKPGGPPPPPLLPFEFLAAPAFSGRGSTHHRRGKEGREEKAFGGAAVLGVSRSEPRLSVGGSLTALGSGLGLFSL